jgi:hypothetical protein
MAASAHRRRPQSHFVLHARWHCSLLLHLIENCSRRGLKCTPLTTVRNMDSLHVVIHTQGVGPLLRSYQEEIDRCVFTPTLSEVPTHVTSVWKVTVGGRGGCAHVLSV